MVMIGNRKPDRLRTARTDQARLNWKLAEAKARFSEVVRLAAAGQPQRVTVRGRNAVVVVAADEFDRLRTQRAATTLHDLLSQSPLASLEFGGDSVRSPVREVDF